jgi:hypothetical protein
MKRVDLLKMMNIARWVILRLKKVQALMVMMTQIVDRMTHLEVLTLTLTKHISQLRVQTMICHMTHLQVLPANLSDWKLQGKVKMVVLLLKGEMI